MNSELDLEPIRRILNYKKLFDIVKVSVELEIYTHISTPPTAQRLSQSLGMHERFLVYLLQTLWRIGFVERSRKAKRDYGRTKIPR